MIVKTRKTFKHPMTKKKSINPMAKKSSKKGFTVAHLVRTAKTILINSMMKLRKRSNRKEKRESRLRKRESSRRCKLSDKKCKPFLSWTNSETGLILSPRLVFYA